MYNINEIGWKRSVIHMNVVYVNLYLRTNANSINCLGSVA